MSDDGKVIPTHVRIARKPHQCSEFGCKVPILPGEKYEHTVWPPMRNEYAQSDRWQAWRSHYPRTGPNGQHLWGCDLAAAYAENERRRQERITAALVDCDIEIECPGCNTDDPEDFRNGCEDPWHVELLGAIAAREPVNAG